MSAELNRALLVALARELTTELADLAVHGWVVAHPRAAAGFVWQKRLPGGMVTVREVRGPEGVQAVVSYGGREWPAPDPLPDGPAALTAVWPEVTRICRLLVERLN